MTSVIAGWLVGLAVLGSASGVGAVTIAFDPASQVVTVGGVATVDLRISGLGDLAAPSLGTFDVDVAFDGSVMSFLGVTYGDPVQGDQLDLFGLGSITGTTPGVGTVNLFELSLDFASDLDTLQAGDFTLARLTFQADAGGVSPLSLSVNALGDADGNPLAADLGTGSVTVRASAVVPEPATLLLLASGLVGLGVTTWRRARRR